MKEVKLQGGKYSLRRDSDQAGDSGPMLISVDPGSWKTESDNGIIMVGMAIRCGSINGRTFASQDWWQTTAVVEILEVVKDEEDEAIQVRFITESGRLYTARVI